MSYPVDEGYVRSNRIWALSIFPLVVLVTGISIYLKLLDYNYFIQSLFTGLAVMFIFQVFSKPEKPAFSIDGDSLRISASRSYPIEKIYRVYVKKTGPEVFRLKILAEEMDKLRTPPLRHGDKLVKELQSINLKIELVDDTKDA